MINYFKVMYKLLYTFKYCYSWTFFFLEMYTIELNYDLID